MLNHPRGFETFCNLVKRLGADISDEVEQGIICDALVIRECFLSAKHSITFHGVDKEASFLKQAGHLCFWITKLKPLSFTTGATDFVKSFITAKVGTFGVRSTLDWDKLIETLLDEAEKGDDTRESAKTARRNLGRLLSPGAAPDEAAKRHAVFPINEYFGLLVGHTMAIEGLELLVQKYADDGDPELAEQTQAAIGFFNARYEVMAHRAIKSFRVNNYSARATATMFEWAYERPWAPREAA